MLAQAPHTGYIHEPFNIDSLTTAGNQFEYLFQYVCKENADHYQRGITKSIGHHYPLIQNLARARRLRHLARIGRDQCVTLYQWARDSRPIVKDPIAFFSAEWLAETFDMDVVVLIRHPAAFCSSLTALGWRFDFSNFLEQPLLMSRYLEPFRDEILEYAANEQGLLSQAILLWKCFYHTVHIYQNNHPDWIFVKHEILSSDPVEQFQKLYEALGLEFTSFAKSSILKSTGSHNPVERATAKSIMRNSKENIFNWKHRLTQDEILRIKKETSELSKLFYTEADW